MFSFATNQWKILVTSSVKPVGCLFCMYGCQTDEILKLKFIHIYWHNRCQKLTGSANRSTLSSFQICLSSFQICLELWTRDQDPNPIITRASNNTFLFKLF